MKITDFELLRIESKVVSYYASTGVSFIHEPEAQWRGWRGAYVHKNGKDVPLRDMIVVTACKVNHPDAPNEEFKLTVTGPRTLFKKIGSHNLLKEYMQPVAQDMHCTLEVNYSKHHAASSHYITITMKRKT